MSCDIHKIVAYGLVDELRPPPNIKLEVVSDTQPDTWVILLNKIIIGTNNIYTPVKLYLRADRVELVYDSTNEHSYVSYYYNDPNLLQSIQCGIDNISYG